MFNYPKQSENACRPGNYPLSVEQHCVKCQRWFVVDAALVNKAMDAWSAPPSDGIGFPMEWCDCTHCGDKQILVMVGKYDPPRAKTRESCGVQFWRWASGSKAGRR